MEDYVLIDTVLQATHMATFTPRPKHIKKYEIKTTRHALTRPEHQPHRLVEELTHDRLTHRDTCRRAFARRDGNEGFGDRKKLKTKGILEDQEKLELSRSRTKVDNLTKEFFLKKIIGPKSLKENMLKTANLFRTPDAQRCLFYDVNFQQVQKRQRNCIITPQTTKRRKRSRQVTAGVSTHNKTFANTTINIRTLIQQEWEEQRRKRQIQSNSGAHMARKKALLLKEAKKQQDKSNGKQYQENETVQIQKWTGHNRNLSAEVGSKNTCPLTQEQINVQAVDIMQKYGIDTSKSYFKYIGS